VASFVFHVSDKLRSLNADERPSKRDHKRKVGAAIDINAVLDDAKCLLEHRFIVEVGSPVMAQLISSLVV
jgi:hypothetical protein